MQTEQLLCWSGMTNTEHRTTSGSNEEDDSEIYIQLFEFDINLVFFFSETTM